MSKWSQLIVHRFGCGHANTLENQTTYQTRKVRRNGMTIIFEGKRCRLCHNAAGNQWRERKSA